MIRVLVVDDHPLMRRGLGELLSGSDDITFVGSATDGAEAPAAVLALEPDVVLMDLSMPEVDGIEATRRVLAARPATAVVVLTSFGEAERIQAALEAGAIGYLLKDAEPDDILRAVRDAAAGGSPLSPRAARALLSGGARPADGRLEALTPREREVLGLVAIGLPNKNIARRLAISEKTVKAHLTRVYSVLGVGDRTSAALWAQRRGLGDHLG